MARRLNPNPRSLTSKKLDNKQQSLYNGAGHEGSAPRTWRCSARQVLQDRVAVVRSAHVEMLPTPGRTPSSTRRPLRARGDAPLAYNGTGRPEPSAPRTWRCSVASDTGEVGHAVRSAHVEMLRPRLRCPSGCGHPLRVRGDVPGRLDGIVSVGGCAPRTWRCSFKPSAEGAVVASARPTRRCTAELAHHPVVRQVRSAHAEAEPVRCSIRVGAGCLSVLSGRSSCACRASRAGGARPDCPVS